MTKNHDLPDERKRDPDRPDHAFQVHAVQLCLLHEERPGAIGTLAPWLQTASTARACRAPEGPDNCLCGQSLQVLNSGCPGCGARCPGLADATDSPATAKSGKTSWRRTTGSASSPRNPSPHVCEEKKAWLQKETGVSLGSDAFFLFVSDNIERAPHKSGVTYVAQTGGSIRDTTSSETADKYNMTMAMTHIRLFHHSIIHG